MQKKTLNPTFGILLGVTILALITITFNVVNGLHIAAFVNFVLATIVYLIPFILFSYMKKGMRIVIQTWEHKDHGSPLPLWIWMYFGSVLTLLFSVGLFIEADQQLFLGATYLSVAISCFFAAVIAVTIWNVFFSAIAERLYGNSRRAVSILKKLEYEDNNIYVFLKENNMSGPASFI